jgi:hypothetical protein
LGGEPQGTGKSEVAHGGGEGDGSGVLLNDLGEFLGGAEVGLMDDAGFAVDPSAFDEVVVEAVALFLFDETSHKG